MPYNQMMISETEIIIRLLIAAGLGALVGLEREMQNQPAGLRTHIVLVTGSALAMCLSINMATQFNTPNGDPARLAAQVISGIGFLGAGAIMHLGATVKGLTTAASMWTMTIVGLGVGAGYSRVAAVVTVLLLVILSLLNILEKRFLQIQIVTIQISALPHPGLATEVRKIVEKSARQISRFSLSQNLKQSRLKIEVETILTQKTTPETLAEQIATIPGVMRVNIS